MKAKRNAALEMNAADFKEVGYHLVDQIAEFIENIDSKPVTYGQKPTEIRAKIGEGNLPLEGTGARELMANASDLMMNNSLFNGHPKFWGYITASASPIGALGDMLTAAVNSNCGAYILSPVATEIEKQTIKWLAELIGYNTDCGGVLVSGGNMANFTGFLAGRTAKATNDLKKAGVGSQPKKMMMYGSKGTHTWIDKAASLFGHGSDIIRWIETNDAHQMDNNKLAEAIKEDLAAGHQPFMVVGTAGDVSMGVVDDLKGIREICDEHDMWMHVDGAYGVPAACLSDQKATFQGLGDADSIALDPHKWLYAPLEAGCTLVKNPLHLVETFSSNPEYYNFGKTEEPETNFFEFGLQNSRSFRALKVWLSLQHAGRNAYEEMIGDDIRLSKLMYELADENTELEAVTHSLSITTFRYVPQQGQLNEEGLNKLNEELVDKLQYGGEVFVSNAVVDGKYCMRACITNFRTEVQDCHDLMEVAVREGRKLVPSA